jgi:MFS superfamily sulfate permease-like transporter
MTAIVTRCWLRHVTRRGVMTWGKRPGTLTVMFKLARGLSPSSFRREWLAKDLVAGVVLTTLLVPQGATAEAVRVQGRGGGTDRRVHRVRQRTRARSGGCRRGGGRNRRNPADPGAAALAAQGPGGAHHGRARDRRDDSLGLAARDVSLVGVLPKGFPPLTLPSVRLADLGPLLAGALGIAVVSLADTISTASAFAARTGQEIDGNGEMIGIGAANLAAGVFQGFPVSTSGSRTAVAERSGAKTQLTGVTGAALIILIIVLVPGLFWNLPPPALAAVVITAALSLADIPGTVRLWRQRKAEFLLSIAAFLGVALLGVLPGIAIAVGLSILNVFRRAWWPYDTVLGRVEGLAGYHDTRSYPGVGQLPGLVIYRFDAPLFFANAKTFRDEIRRLATAEPKPQWIVIAAEPVTDVDTTASDVLEELDEALNAQGISLVFAELKDPVRRKIEQYGLTRTIDPRHFFPTIGAAVTAFRQETGAEWPADTSQPRDIPAPPVG